jgi:transposase
LKLPIVIKRAFCRPVLEDPGNFKSSRSVAAWLGLTTRRYQSGGFDNDGHISRRGDAHMRGLLYEATTVLLTRSRLDSDLRNWGLKLWERLGFKRAAVAVARKLPVDACHAEIRGTLSCKSLHGLTSNIRACCA